MLLKLFNAYVKPELTPIIAPIVFAVLIYEKLLRAYETLKDEGERRKYYLVYPSLKGRNASDPYARERNTTSVPNPTEDETVQIPALRLSIQERAVRWRTSKMVFDTSVFKAERIIEQLKTDVEVLVTIAAAEAAEEAQRNRWTTSILSPIYKRAENSEEVKAQKDRARQERRIERDMKER